MRKLIVSVCIWALVGFCGFFIWKMGMARANVSQNPHQSLKYYKYSAALLADNNRIIGEKITAEQSKHIQQSAKEALAKAPLSDVALVQTALAKTLIRGKFYGYDLFQLAKQRNRYNRRALRGLLAMDIAQNNIPNVFENLDILIRIGGSDLNIYYEAMTQITQRIQNRELVNNYIKKRPVWALKILFDQITIMKIEDIPNVYAALQHYSSPPHSFRDNRKLYERFLEKIILLQAYDQAYVYWAAMFPDNGNYRSSLIHDPDFKGSSAFTPFNWKFIRGQNYFAEIDQPSGMYVSYNGKQDRVLARQIIRLTPDTEYRFDVDGQWDYLNRQGTLIWRVQCLPKRKTIVELMMDENHKEEGLVSAIFTTPKEQCGSQIIQLIGKNGQYSKRIWARVRSVNISVVGP